jgi:hypothetical protein
MKTLDSSQPGRRGLTVSQGGRYGRISRAFVVPANPRTAAQTGARRAFAQAAARWRSLAEDARNAWRMAAAVQNTLPRPGQSSRLTGRQLFMKINCSLAMLGLEPVSAPPPFPQFTDNPVGALAITNAGGVIRLKLACPSTPAAHTMVRAAAPCSPGRAYCDDYRFVGVLPAPAQGWCDITSLYTARYGSPAVGTKVFVRVNQNVNGWEDMPVEAWGIVPAAA